MEGVSHLGAPLMNPRRIGALEDKATALGGLGKLKKKGDLVPLSTTPTLISGSALWEEKDGRINLPTHTFDIGNVKEETSCLCST